MTDSILINLPTHLETPRLQLRIPLPGDGPLVHSMLLDGYQDFAYWLNFPKTPPTVTECEKQSRIQMSEWIDRSSMRYLCIERESKKIIGRLAFPPQLCNWQVPLFGISYIQSESFRGNGYLTEATKR